MDANMLKHLLTIGAIAGTIATSSGSARADCSPRFCGVNQVVFGDSTVMTVMQEWPALIMNTTMALNPKCPSGDNLIDMNRL
jgi:hypothetical protein